MKNAIGTIILIVYDLIQMTILDEIRYVTINKYGRPMMALALIVWMVAFVAVSYCVCKFVYEHFFKKEKEA